MFNKLSKLRRISYIQNVPCDMNMLYFIYKKKNVIAKKIPFVDKRIFCNPGCSVKHMWMAV